MAIQVEFKTSGKTAPWQDRHKALLDMTEANDIKIETDCRSGICGTCKTRLLSGKVGMEVEDGLDEDDIEQNMVLPCVATPINYILLEV